MVKHRKFKKKTITIAIIILLLLILILASGYTVLIRPSLQETKINYEATKVNRGSVEVTVNESGAIAYTQTEVKYELNLDLSEDDDDDDDDEETVIKYLVVEEVYKAAGEKINTGDQLLKFEKNSIESVRRLLAAAVADAQVDYNDAKSTYELNCLSAELDYKSNLITADYAKKIYNESKASVKNSIASAKAEIEMREGKIASLQTAVDEATETYNTAYEEYIASKEYFDNLDSSNAGIYLSYQKTYQQKQNAYTNALSALDNAKQALENNASQISKLKTQLTAAQSSKDVELISVEQEYQEDVQSGDNAYLVYLAKVESYKEELKESEDSLKKIEDKQKDFEELVGADGIIRAQKDGLLVAVNVSVGDELTNEKTMFSYVTADDLTITVNVTEEDVVALSVGQSVDIEFVAYPDENYVGIINSIDTTATSSNAKTVSYPVVIGIVGDLTRMFEGMTAGVSFQTAVSEDTLFINRKALVEKNDSYYVYVKSGLDDYELKKVTIGLKNTSFVEITSGLNENDTVYIASTGV